MDAEIESGNGCFAVLLGLLAVLIVPSVAIWFECEDFVATLCVVVVIASLLYEFSESRNER